MSDWDKWSSSSKTNGRGNDFQHIVHKIESPKHIEYDSKFCNKFLGWWMIHPANECMTKTKTESCFYWRKPRTYPKSYAIFSARTTSKSWYNENICSINEFKGMKTRSIHHNFSENFAHFARPGEIVLPLLGSNGRVQHSNQMHRTTRNVIHRLHPLRIHTFYTWLHIIQAWRLPSVNNSNSFINLAITPHSWVGW